MKTTPWFGLLALAIALAVAGCAARTSDDGKDSARTDQAASGQLVTVAVPGMT